MLSFLVTYYSSITADYNIFIADIKCNMHLLYLMRFVLQQRNEKIANIYVMIVFPILTFSCLCCDKEYFYSQVWLIIIDNNYVIIIVVFQLFINYGMYGGNRQQSMLSLLKKKTVLIHKQQHENISNTRVRIFVNLQQSRQWFLC